MSIALPRCRLAPQFQTFERREANAESGRSCISTLRMGPLPTPNMICIYRAVALKRWLPCRALINPLPADCSPARRSSSSEAHGERDDHSRIDDVGRRARCDRLEIRDVGIDVSDPRGERLPSLARAERPVGIAPAWRQRGVTFRPADMRVERTRSALDRQRGIGGDVEIVVAPDRILRGCVGNAER